MYQLVKRLLDLIVSVVLIICLTPVAIPLVVLLRLTGEGYVFYYQERIGYMGRTFKVVKFATMLKDSPNMPGGIITRRKDNRLTPMGAFLRRTKLNEVPQLLNVLKGEMSIVGPRPVLLESYLLYSKEVQSAIYSVKPGLTGIGSIIYRDEEALITKELERGGDIWTYYRDVIYMHKGKLEEWYRDHQSLSIDLLIVFITVLVVLRPKSELLYKLLPSLPRS